MEKDFTHIFIAEAEELIESLEKNVLDLEKNSESIEGINEIFRVMHTLKGTSDMFGFAPIRELTHKLESLFDTVRKGQCTLNPDLLDLTFKSIDHLRKLLTDNELRNTENQKTHQELLNLSDQFVISDDHKKVKDKTINQVNQAEDQKSVIVQITFTPNENLLNRGINLLGIFQDLAKVGSFTIEEIPDLTENALSTWKIFIETNQKIELIEDIFLFVLDCCEISILNSDDPEKNEDIQKIITGKGEKDEIVKNNKLSDTYTTEQTEINNKENNKNITPKKEASTEENKNLNYNEIGKQVTSRISVDAEKLDKLMNLVSELVTTNTQLKLISNQKKYDKLPVLVEKIESLSNLFRDNTLSIRLIPINDLVIRFRRLIRDLSTELHKDIEFITDGLETELDKNIIDNLAEPLMHLIRNAIDHGIETPGDRLAVGKEKQGTIKLSAYHSGSNVYVQIHDNGRGLDPEKIKAKAIQNRLIKPDENLSQKEIYNLIFLPGFSTADKVTQLSGRGVGMDVVKRKITEMHGDIAIESETGLGTLFTIKLHQTISIIDSLMISIDNSFFLIPNSEIDFCIEKDFSEITESQNHRIRYNNQLIPFINLRELFKYKTPSPDKNKLIVIKRDNQFIAIVADQIIGEHQAVIKPLGQVFHEQDFLVGASIMGDGNFAFMLDINKLIRKNNIK